MSSRGQHTFAEIMSQPVIWEEVLRSFRAIKAKIADKWDQLKINEVIFIGCGSTYYLSQSAAALFQKMTGIRTRACPSSDVLLFPNQVLASPGQTLMVAISRSGTTTETIQAVNRFRALGGLAVWAISCYPENDLAQMSDVAILAEAAQEKSIAQTRSFSSMLLLTKALTTIVAGLDLAPLDELPNALRQILEDTTDLVQGLGQQLDLRQLFFLGSGPQYGIANEVMLKMKEMSLTNSEAYHFLEFRHGPMSMANEQALVVGLVSQEARPHEELVLKEMGNLGANTLGLNTGAKECCKHPIRFGGSLPAWAQLGLNLPPLQLMAYHRAIAKGLDPDNPRNLEAVISLDPASFASA